MNKLTRRSLIGGLLASTVAVANAKPRATEVYEWDEEFDMIIIGSGFAGLSAAYEANRRGLKKIIILEKMEVFGGNSALCGGLMCMPLTKLQKSKGIKDSPELMVKDMIKAGRGFNHPALALELARNANKVFDMLNTCGVKFMDKVIRLGGHSAPRAHLPTNASGGGIVVPMHNYLKGKGIEFRNKTEVQELVIDSTGVQGVIAAVNYNWQTSENQGLRALRAKYGVVVASGGWGQDHEFVSTTMPAYSLLESTAQPGATATMIKAMLSAGVLPVMLDMFQLGPWATPDEKGAGPGSFFADYAFAEGMAIDPTTGKRFMNELSDRRTRADALLVIRDKSTPQKPIFPFCFCGEETTTRSEGFKAAYREGTVKKSNTVEDLAKLHGVPLKALKQSIVEWNEVLSGKRKDPFAKPLDIKTELKAPYYSMRLSPKLHYCMGGAAITTKAEVISAKNCKPISGLYAAGEVTGGTHGMDRLGGCSSVDGLVFGQIAGREIALRAKKMA